MVRWGEVGRMRSFGRLLCFFFMFFEEEEDAEGGSWQLAWNERWDEGG